MRHFFREGKPVAAICHAPWVLIDASVIRGRTVTSWPAIKTDIRNAGANWVDQEVVVDNGLVTSRKPDDIPAFNKKITSKNSVRGGTLDVWNGFGGTGNLSRKLPCKFRDLQGFMILDPIAAKGLLLSGIITLSITNWSTGDQHYGKFPAWFPVLVITRDAVIVVGSVQIEKSAASHAHCGGNERLNYGPPRS